MMQLIESTGCNINVQRTKCGRLLNWPVFVVAGDDGMFEDDSVGFDDVPVVDFGAIIVVAGCVSLVLVDSMSALLSVFLYQLKMQNE